MAKLGRAPTSEAWAKAWTKTFAKSVRDEANGRGRLSRAGARRIMEQSGAARFFGDNAVDWLVSNDQKSVKADKLISLAYGEALAAAKAVAGPNNRVSLKEGETLPSKFAPEFFVLRGKRIPGRVLAKLAQGSDSAALTPARVDQIVTKALEDFGLEDLPLAIDGAEVIGQANEFGGSVKFDTALRRALHSFLFDGSNEESPLAIIANIGEGEWSQDTPTDTVRWFANRPDARLSINVRDYDEDADHPVPPEDQETVADNWCFSLRLNQLSDHFHWAIVDRTGDKPAYNYGFN